jgi:serine/threonine-protein kinase RsbW
MGNSRIKHFVIENQIGELPKLADKIEQLAERWEMSQALSMNINLVIEEATSNIINYAFIDDKKHEIRISISLINNLLTIIITDNGIPFNPLQHQQPDISLSAEERPVGGLGIFLISQIMDKMHYTREENRNILKLIKNIEHEN